MLDAVILSDIHLGSDNCQAKLVCEMLERIEREEIATRQLILNGDVFDSMDFRRLKRSHWKVLSLIRRLSDRLEIIWLCGNHDGSAEIISHLLGVEVRDDYILESGKERMLILHGHVFDNFLDNHPILTWIADSAYWALQLIDRSHYLAKVAKKGSKTFLRCAKKIEDRSVALAKRLNCTMAICGHTHVATANRDQPIPYFNSGCWTELPCHYLTVKDGVVDLHRFESTQKVKTEQKEPALAGA